ncbi:MAG: hypothetical protein WAN35_21335, partial [Terracidiphilus sp.]
MKILRLWVVALGFYGILYVVASAQGTAQQLETPKNVSVKANLARQIYPGQRFDFELRFDPPPNGYGEGEIHYKFQRVDSGPPEPVPESGQTSFSGQTALVDGKGAYPLSLDVTGAMVPGTWELVSATLGSAYQQSIPIEGAAAFEIPQIPPVVVHVDAPKIVSAGQRFTLTVTLDEYPKAFFPSDCSPVLVASLSTVPGGPANQGAIKDAVQPVKLVPGSLKYEMSGSFYPDTPKSPWAGEVNVKSWGALGPAPQYCRSPQTQGDFRFDFTVEPAANLVTPKSVAVTINPAQIKLLHDEADRLTMKREDLKSQLSMKNAATGQVLLRRSVNDALSDLNKTESEYKQKEENGVGPSSARAINAFFGEIRHRYHDALKSLPSDSAQISSAGARLERVNAAPIDSVFQQIPGSNAVLKSFHDTAVAYELAASSGTMTRDLDVLSEPEGATVSYWQKGEPINVLEHETDSKIQNIFRAFYYIKFQKRGYYE